MEERLVKVLLKLREKSFFRAVQRTFAMLAPFVLIAAIFQGIYNSFLLPNSIFFNILGFDNVLSHAAFRSLRFVFSGVSWAIFGTFGVFAAYYMALYTARIYDKDSKLAGISAIFVLFFIREPRQNFDLTSLNLKMLSVKTMLWALIIGYIVGQIFHLLGAKYQDHKYEHVAGIKERALASFKPIVASVGLAIVTGTLINFLQINVAQSSYITGVASSVITSNNLLISIPLVTFSIFLHWLGIGTPIMAIFESTNSGAATANFNYALTHGSSWNVPYKYLGSSLVQSYGTLSGTAFVFSLIVVILLIDKNKYNKVVAKASLFPVMFNSIYGFWVAFPIYLNPLILIPLLLVPLANMVASSFAIFLHLVPVSVYPVLSGTPGVLIPYIGTNGSWQALLLTALLLVMDVFIVMPFYKIHMNVEAKLEELDKQRDAGLLPLKKQKKFVKSKEKNNEKITAEQR